MKFVTQVLTIVLVYVIPFLVLAGSIVDMADNWTRRQNRRKGKR